MISPLHNAGVARKSTDKDSAKAATLWERNVQTGIYHLCELRSRTAILQRIMPPSSQARTAA
jgi:hypothetical protein